MQAKQVLCPSHRWLTHYVETLERSLYGESVRGLLIAPAVTDRAEQLLTSKELEFISLSRRFQYISADTTDRIQQ